MRNLEKSSLLLVRDWLFRFYCLGRREFSDDCCRDSTECPDSLCLSEAERTKDCAGRDDGASRLHGPQLELAAGAEKANNFAALTGGGTVKLISTFAPLFIILFACKACWAAGFFWRTETRRIRSGPEPLWRNRQPWMAEAKLFLKSRLSPGNDWRKERFDHLSIDVVAVELVQLRQPELRAGVVVVGQRVRVSA